MLDDFDDAEEKPSAVRNSGAEKQLPKERRKIKPEFTEESSSEKSAKRGIATHNFLQFFDIANFDMNGAEAELSRLIARGFISKANGALVEMSEIEKFRKSQFFTEMKKAEKIYREFRFNTRLPAKYFNFEDEILEKITDEELLVQGVIDCILVDSDGEIHLVDYKTDRLKKEELENPEKAAKKLNESHAPQLSCYALTIEKIFGKKPKTVRVYSLPLGDTVDIKLLNFDKI
jgi:ATP-dependent helicase/nuclease subunit A